MNKRPSTHQSSDVANPVEGEEPLGDLVSTWANDLRATVVTDFEPHTVDTVAGLAAEATMVSAGSLAAAAGNTAGGLTGGHTMSSFIATTMGKIAVSAALATSIATGGAAFGALPDPLQTGAADIAELGGIELPRPDVRINVEGAGEVVVELVDGVLNIVDLDATGAWDASVVSETDTTVVVDFVSDTTTKTVTIVSDTAGEVNSTVETVTGSIDSTLEGSTAVNGEADANSSGGAVNVDAEGGASSEGTVGSSKSGSEVGGNVETEIEADLGIEIDTGLGG